MTSVVYIGGTGRSGSTLLARMLSELPGVVAVGELRYVLDRGFGANHLCGCGKPFRDCPFWGEVFARALPDCSDDRIAALVATSRAVDRNRFIPALLWARLRSPSFREEHREYASFLRRTYAAIVEVSGARVVVDSSKDPSYAFVLQSLSDIDLTVLHLVRDSRAVAFSWMREKVRPEVQGEVTHMAKRRPAKSAALWTGYNLAFEWLSRHVTRYRRVRYEDFVAQPDDSFRGLAHWLGLDASAPTPVTVHDISGNPLRFSTQPRAVKADDEWKARLAPKDRRVVDLITAPVRWRYGYRGGDA